LHVLFYLRLKKLHIILKLIFFFEFILRSKIKMLDLFTIFSKGGIVLWYFQGTSQLFTNSVNELIKSVILQVKL
jgi:hypothetical protein